MSKQRIKRGAHWRQCVEETPDGCLIWQGQIDAKGYGRRSGVLAHRHVYEIEVGPIPDDLPLDHLCRNRPCVNPAHLEPVAQAENLARSPITLSSVNAAKTHCIRGHEFTEANTLHELNRGRYPTRTCRMCKRLRRKAVAA